MCARMASHARAARWQAGEAMHRPRGRLMATPAPYTQDSQDLGAVKKRQSRVGSRQRTVKTEKLGTPSKYSKIDGMLVNSWSVRLPGAEPMLLPAQAPRSTTHGERGACMHVHQEPHAGAVARGTGGYESSLSCAGITVPCPQTESMAPPAASQRAGCCCPHAGVATATPADGSSQGSGATPPSAAALHY
jgi:hypothetical protein